MDEEENSIQDELRIQILVADQVVKLAQETEYSKPSCLELALQATHLFQLLRSTAQITASAHSLYDRPLRRIISDVSTNLRRALLLLQSCRNSGILSRFLFSSATTTALEFRNVANLLESSISDVMWLVSVFNFNVTTTDLSLPSIANNNPFLSCVWSYIAAVQMGQPVDRLDGANNLAFFATDDRNKKLIVDEGGIPPLLDLLKEGDSHEAQIAALTALYNLATYQESVQLMYRANAVSVLAEILGDSLIDIQVLAVNLVSRMAEMDSDVQEEFGRENVTSTVLTLLSRNTPIDENNEMLKNMSINNDKVKISCANALWKISKGSLLNCKIIGERKALLCVAKLVEKERGDLRTICLNTLTELAAVAEFDAELRRTAFKPKSDSMTFLLDQLLRVLIEEKDPELLVPTIKSFGSLARTFPAKETRVIGLLVAQLGHSNVDVSTEASLALAKFVCPENFNRMEHSKSIIEFQGVQGIVNLIMLKSDDRSQVCGLVLLCYLALYGGNCSALVQARVLNVLEGGVEFAVSFNPELRELFAQAIHQLVICQAGAMSYS